MTDAFRASRADGRSDRRIVIDLAANATPGDTFTFDTLLRALQEGTERTIGHATVGAAVRTANQWLLKEQKILLHSVPGVGYRIAHATEHRGLALVRKRAADRQLAWGVKTLQHVRWDEMDANSRAAHEAQLMIMGSLYQAVRALGARQTKLEKLVGQALEGAPALAR
jgi:hypothetical protein